MSDENWGTRLIKEFLHPFTLFVTPLFILFLMGYFLLIAFKVNVYSGIRSLAAILMPLILVTFIVVFKKELLEKLGKISPLISCVAAYVVGIFIMMAVNFLSNLAMPISEFILSGSFSILVFSHVSLQENNMLSYYYGMILGFLTYIIFYGFPIQIGS